jgi:hypothetical protein
MVFPLWFRAPFLGRAALFGAVLSNATADGKRLRAIDAVSIQGIGRTARKDA